MKAVHCYKPAERRSKVVPLLLWMCTHEVFTEETTRDSAAEKNDEDDTQPVRVDALTLKRSIFTSGSRNEGKLGWASVEHEPITGGSTLKLNVKWK